MKRIIGGLLLLNAWLLSSTASAALRFPVASDTDGKIANANANANAYDLAVNEATRGRKDKRGVQVDHGSVDRTTFIVGTDGKVIATLGGLDPASNVAKALAAVQKLR